MMWNSNRGRGIGSAAASFAALAIPALCAGQAPRPAVDVMKADIDAVIAAPDGGADRQIKVVDVGKLTALEPGEDDRTRRRAETEAVPITFALSTADAQRVAYAESFATHVRLALVGGGAEAPVSADDRSYTLDEDK